MTVDQPPVLPDTASRALTYVAGYLDLADRLVEEVAAARDEPVRMSGEVQSDLRRLAHWLEEHPEVDREAWSYVRADPYVDPYADYEDPGPVDVSGLRERLRNVRGGRDDVDMTEQP